MSIIGCNNVQCSISLLIDKNRNGHNCMDLLRYVNISAFANQQQHIHEHTQTNIYIYIIYIYIYIYIYTYILKSISFCKVIHDILKSYLFSYFIDLANFCSFRHFFIFNYVTSSQLVLLSLFFILFLSNLLFFDMKIISQLNLNLV